MRVHYCFLNPERLNQHHYSVLHDFVPFLYNRIMGTESFVFEYFEGAARLSPGAQEDEGRMTLLLQLKLSLFPLYTPADTRENGLLLNVAMVMTPLFFLMSASKCSQIVLKRFSKRSICKQQYNPIFRSREAG